MVINKSNQEKIEEIYLHDAIFNDLVYNHAERFYILTLTAAHNAVRYQFIFTDCIYFMMQGCEFYGSSERFSGWYLTENKRLFDNIRGNQSYDAALCDFPIEQYIGVAFELISGDTIEILCKDIVIREESQQLIPENVLPDLSCDKPADVQERTIQLILADVTFDCTLLLQPKLYGGTSIWENCARILTQKSDDFLIPYLGSLMRWLKDMETPGAGLIRNRLETVQAEKIMMSFLICFNEAAKNNDRTWLENLSAIPIKNKELSNLLGDKIKRLYDLYF